VFFTVSVWRYAIQNSCPVHVTGIVSRKFTWEKFVLYKYLESLFWW